MFKKIKERVNYFKRYHIVNDKFKAIKFLLESKKYELLILNRQNVEQNKQKKLIHEINVLCEILNEPKIDEVAIWRTLRCYTTYLSPR